LNLLKKNKIYLKIVKISGFSLTKPLKYGIIYIEWRIKMNIQALKNGKVVKKPLSLLISEHINLSDGTSWYICSLGSKLQKLEKALESIVIDADDADAWNGLDSAAVDERLHSIINKAEKALK